MKHKDAVLWFGTTRNELDIISQIEVETGSHRGERKKNSMFSSDENKDDDNPQPSNHIPRSRCKHKNQHTGLSSSSVA